MADRLRTLEAIDGRGTDVCGTAVPRTQTILSGMAPDGEIIRLRFVQPCLGKDGVLGLRRVAVVRLAKAAPYFARGSLVAGAKDEAVSASM